MKKFMALLLVLTFTLGLCACNSNPYKKYEYINKMLDEGDYEGAIKAIYQLYQLEQNMGGGNNNGSNNGGSNNGGSNNGGAQVKEEPTEEEIKLLNQYKSIHDFLKKYAEDGYGSVYDYEAEKSYDEQNALQFCYETLPELGGIDKWADTEYVKEHWDYSKIENWDREILLRGFTIVENVALNMSSTTKDNLGNVNTNKNITRWYYNIDGMMDHLYGETNTRIIRHMSQNSTCWFAYDAQGNLVEKTYGSGDSVNARVTYTYDVAGNITSEQLKTNSGETVYNYTYENGRLAQIAWQGDEVYRYTIDYTYDDAGNLIKEKKTYYHLGSLVKVWTKTEVFIMEYAYTNGKLTSGTYTYQYWSYDQAPGDNAWYVTKEYATQERVDRYTYTCDGAGRATKWTIVPGNTVVAYGSEEGKVISTPSYETKTYETVYGNYYIYTPVQ